MDAATAKLAECAVNSDSVGTAEIDFVEVASDAAAKPVCYLRYKLDRCFVKSWSTFAAAHSRPSTVERYPFFWRTEHVHKQSPNGYRFF